VGAIIFRDGGPDVRISVRAVALSSPHLRWCRLPYQASQTDMKSSGPRSQNGIPGINYSRRSQQRVASPRDFADILYNLNRCARTRRSCVFDMSANMNGIAIRRGLSRGGESAIIQSSRWPSTVIEHVQPFSSGRPSPSIPALYIRGATMAWPRINIPNVGSDGFMTVKGVQVAYEFWHKNYRGRYYVTS